MVRSKNKAANLQYTGLFGSACRHEFPLLFENLRHGERYKVPCLTSVTITPVSLAAMVCVYWPMEGRTIANSILLRSNFW